MAAIYQADIYCNECVEEIKKNLCTTGTVEKLEDVGVDLNDETTYDSDDYPKYYNPHEESDCPQHCADCKEFLENSLTNDGFDYVRNAIENDLYNGNFDSIACTVWAGFYGFTVNVAINAEVDDIEKIDKILLDMGYGVEYTVKDP